MRVRVVTDSSASVPDEYLARLGIGEALATVNFGSESYFAKAETPLETFYRRLETADKLPTTSQPAPEQFAQAYERAAAAGADEIVAVCVSSQLSGTFNSAVIAAQSSPVPVQESSVEPSVFPEPRRATDPSPIRSDSNRSHR